MSSLKKSAHKGIDELAKLAAKADLGHMDTYEISDYENFVRAYVSHLEAREMESPVYINNEARRGTLAIHPGGEHTRPCLVHVGGRNGFDLLVLKVINKTELTFCQPEGNTLLNYDIDVLERLQAEWDLENAKKSVERRQKALEELNSRQKSQP